MGELRCATVCLPFVLSAARHCVRSHAGHVTERPRLGFPFARSAAAEVNYSCVQIGHAILRRHPITGAVQRGNSVTHSVADATRNWCFDSGRPAELNNLRRAGCRLRNADDAARNIQRAPIRLHFASDAPGLASLHRPALYAKSDTITLLASLSRQSPGTA